MTSKKKGKVLTIPKRQTGYRSCKPLKNIFGLLTIKRMIHKDLIVPCKYVHPKNYSSNEAKEIIKNIKENIIKKSTRIDPVIVVNIRGVFNITNSSHVRTILAIGKISYKSITTHKLDKLNVSLLVYPYISKEETAKMCG